MDQPTLITALINLNGGTLVGKTRLQKSVYLLESFGIELGFDFDYHHYGPYSEDLSNASKDAETLGFLEVEWRSAYGNEYAVYKSHSQAEANLPPATAAVLKTLANYDAVTLELAATADFLQKNGYSSDPWTETVRRKASKITASRIESSKKLLSELASVAQ